MLPRNHPDRIQIAFDDHRLVANAGLILRATLALRLGLPQLLRMTLVASALAGGDCKNNISPYDATYPQAEEDHGYGN